MKKVASLMAFIAILVLAFSGCTRNENKTVQINTLDLAVEEVFAEDIMEDILAESYDILFDAFEFGILKSDGEYDGPQCRLRTVERPEDEKWPKVVTLDFGDGCEDEDGNIRSGKIIVTITGNLREEGSVRTLTFEDYYVNGNKVEGEKTMTNTGREDGFIVFSIELAKSKIIRKDSVVIERDALKTRTWIVGEETPEGRDDVFLINGTVNRTNKDGLLITKTINNLMRARNCRFPLSGTVEISTEEYQPLAVIDYGDGECDKFATVTIGEGDETESWIINLRKKGIKWEKPDENTEASNTDG